MSKYTRFTTLIIVAAVALGRPALAQTDPGVLFGAKPKPQAQADPRAQAQAHFKNAIEAQKAGKIDKAIKEYRALIKIAPTFPAPYFNLGMIYMQKNQPSNAEAALKRGIALDPKNEMATEQLVRILVVEGKTKEALTYCRKLMSQKPKEPRF
ncbi:MAG: tetratricopeptide repeat protein, partial [Armatimonadetes bacterium]|nr:tetratricopeptide repeat protein [Armatimonadota bacterium]